MSTIPLYKAEFSVKQEKSKWIRPDAIQVMYHYEDEKRFKQEVYIRDQYTCQYCGLQMHPAHPLLTVDHVIPKRLAGSILPKNMVCACKNCNEQKGHRTVQEYLLHLYIGVTFMVLWWRNKRRRDIVHDGTSKRIASKNETIPPPFEIRRF